MSMFRKALGALAIAGVMTLTIAGTAFADIPFNQQINGPATYYNDQGYGACGTQIDASSQMLVAVSPSYWTASNPNNDPLCQGVSVQVSYNGSTITVPVEDQCPGCDSTHIDLSEPAFVQLAGSTDAGNIQVTWQFVHS
jgi:expansin (peptidoglycan-binding protein)